MFTGIVKGLGTVVSGHARPGLATFVVEMPAGYVDGLQIGASVAIDGVCLTATEITASPLLPQGGVGGGHRVSFDAMQETLEKTTVGSLVEGSRVNVERSYRIGDEVGGHIVSGHVTGTADLIAIETAENNHIVTFRVDPSWMKYLLPKGFVALDGCSLTIVDVNRDDSTFTVWLIPETLRTTAFGFKKPGDRANLEIDSKTQAIVDTVEAYLSARPSFPTSLIRHE